MYDGNLNINDVELGSLLFWYAHEGRFKDMPTQVHVIVGYPTEEERNRPGPRRVDRVDTRMVARWDGREWVPIKNGQINSSVGLYRYKKVDAESVGELVRRHTNAIDYLSALVK